MEMADLLWIVIPAFIFFDGVLPWIITIIAIGYALSGNVGLKLENNALHTTENQQNKQNLYLVLELTKTTQQDGINHEENISITSNIICYVNNEWLYV